MENHQIKEMVAKFIGMSDTIDEFKKQYREMFEQQSSMVKIRNQLKKDIEETLIEHNIEEFRDGNVLFKRSLKRKLRPGCEDKLPHDVTIMKNMMHVKRTKSRPKNPNTE